MIEAQRVGRPVLAEVAYMEACLFEGADSRVPVCLWDAGAAQREPPFTIGNGSNRLCGIVRGGRTNSDQELSFSA